MPRKWVSAVFVAGFAAALGFAAPAKAGPTVEKIKQAGGLSCGVPTGIPGFGMPDSQGKYSGLDVDICRAISAAVFGDPDKVKYVPLTAQQRFTALQSGEVDILSNNTTVTLSRDTQLGLNFAPVVRHGDEEWHDIVDWTIYALIEAEEKGISQKNLDEMAKSESPDIKRMLGSTPGMGKSLGLDEKWAYNAIKAVGNYGEIFDRHLGLNTPLKLERGYNNLWTKGGLIYAMPIR